MIDIFEHIYNFIKACFEFLKLGAVALSQIPHYLTYLTQYLTAYISYIPSWFGLCITSYFSIGLLKFITNRGGDD